MVAPQLAQWNFPDRDAPWDRHTGAIGILRIKFIPEPSGWTMLIAGMASLCVFSWLGGRETKTEHQNAGESGKARR
jgi:hypothetical protein